MKKYILITTSLITMACSNKKEHNNDTSNDITELQETSCNCSELSIPLEDYPDDEALGDRFKNVLKDGKPYSGICLTKDQNDSIVRRIDFKNGWTVKRITREKLGNSYLTLSDISYDGLVPKVGYYIHLSSDGGAGIKFTNEYYSIVGGAVDKKSSWVIYFDQSYSVGINQRANSDGDFIWDSVDGLRLVISKNIKSKLGDCLKLLKGTNNLTGEEEYYIEAASKEQGKEVLECLKGHLEHFSYNIE
jgi:hypothetical protein